MRPLDAEGIFRRNNDRLLDEVTDLATTQLALFLAYLASSASAKPLVLLNKFKPIRT